MFVGLSAVFAIRNFDTAVSEIFPVDCDSTTISGLKELVGG